MLAYIGCLTVFKKGKFMGSKASGEKDTKQKDLQKLAQNLSALLKLHHLNTNQLAQILGIPMMTIRRLLSGETTDPRISTLKLVANYFNVPIDFLVEGDEQTLINSLKKSQLRFIPKLNWDIVERITTIKDLDLSQWEGWQSLSLRDQDIIGENAFALDSRPSMHPRFPQGTVFIIDPNVDPVDGDMVLVKLKKSNELTLRELVIDPPEWKLHSVVIGSTILLYSDEQHEIVGVNSLTMFYNRKT